MFFVLRLMLSDNLKRADVVIFNGIKRKHRKLNTEEEILAFYYNTKRHVALETTSRRASVLCLTSSFYSPLITLKKLLILNSCYETYLFRH